MTPEPIVAIPSAPTTMHQSIQPDLTSTVTSLAAGSGDNYKLPGNRNNVSAAEFTAALDKHQSTLPDEVVRLVSPRIAGTKEYAGVQVYQCLGAYRGDEYCIKCVLRKSCITRR